VVFAPSLTGLGERAHLLSRSVGLETHVRDVLGVLEYEDLRGVILVGCSYGGTVISVVADRAPERLAHLVYLDAQVGRDSHSVLDTQQPAERAGDEQAAQTLGEGWLWPAVTGLSPAVFAKYVQRGEMSEEEARVIAARTRYADP
jgi:pimeloyl-ACP methyl ester carboxylesterase